MSQASQSVHVELLFHSLALLCFVAGPTMRGNDGTGYLPDRRISAFALLVILSGGLLTFALVTATADLEALAFPGPV